MILRRFRPGRDLSINQCRLPESRPGAKKEPGRLAWQPPGLFLCNIDYPPEKTAKSKQGIFRRCFTRHYLIGSCSNILFPAESISHAMRAVREKFAVELTPEPIFL